MKPIAYQLLSRRLLDARKSGYSFGWFLRINRKIYLIRTLASAVALGMVAYTEVWSAFCLLMGLVLSSYLTDLRWYMTIRRNWPFSVASTDWHRIERMAAGESPTDR